MYIEITSIIALAVGSIVASPTIHRGQSIGAPASAVVNTDDIPPSSQVQEPSLNPPRMQSSHKKVERAEARGTQATIGYIQVFESNGDKPIGFVANELNSFGEYGNITGSTEEALKVKFNLTSAVIGPTDIATLNGSDNNFTFFGAINGYSSMSNDIGKGSPNYQYIGATKKTPPNSPPSSPGNSFTAATNITETSESAIFRYHAKTRVIKPYYVNTNKSSPHTFAGVNKNGDKYAFAKSFGNTTWITFKFLPE